MGQLAVNQILNDEGSIKKTFQQFPPNVQMELICQNLFLFFKEVDKFLTDGKKNQEMKDHLVDKASELTGFSKTFRKRVASMFRKSATVPKENRDIKEGINRLMKREGKVAQIQTLTKKMKTYTDSEVRRKDS